MTSVFQTIDLFAGPGGLAEGFAGYEAPDGSRPFSIVLSVEKDPSAFSTLRLRAFFRRFESVPEAYYSYIAGDRAQWDILMRDHPREWQAAVRETEMLELGTEQAQQVLDLRIDQIVASGANTILIGGPPCQAYSLAGRARNQGTAGYVAAEDGRHFLYKEYIRILERLKPVAFVMENVKGILSAKVDDDPIFSQVVADLRNAGGSPNSYTLLSLVQAPAGSHTGNIVRAEEFGIPQSRHRVILLGIRTNCLPAGIEGMQPHLLRPSERRIDVRATIGGMPALRSGLSSADDSATTWKKAAAAAFRSAAKACDRDGVVMRDVAIQLRKHAATLNAMKDVPPRASQAHGSISDNWLASRLIDKNLRGMPNHETRSHMKGDLARYAFASTFAELRKRSPKADEFPAGLAPKHRSWASGNFADRFRVQVFEQPSTTVVSHIAKDGHYFIHPDPIQCRSLTVREAARLQTFPDNYYFLGNRTAQYTQVGNAVPPLLARQIAEVVHRLVDGGTFRQDGGKADGSIERPQTSRLKALSDP